MDLNQDPQIPSPPPVGENIQNTHTSQNTTVMAVLSYLGILVIIPYLTDAKRDPFVKFHIKQGVVLLIAWIAVWILGMMPILGIFAWILDIILVVLMIMGIINAASGKQVPLPVIGGMADKITI